jgi:hypothetical protein
MQAGNRRTNESFAERTQWGGRLDDALFAYPASVARRDSLRAFGDDIHPETMIDKEKHIKRRERMEAFRKSQHELAKLANNPNADPLIKLIARCRRRQEKKKTFTGHA